MIFTPIQNETRQLTQPISAGLCISYTERLCGYMFHKSITQDEALLFVQNTVSRVDSAIHMFFVPFDLAVIWVDQNKVVTDTCLARSWRPFYMPAHPAKYILETHPIWLSSFQKGDRLIFNYE